MWGLQCRVSVRSILWGLYEFFSGGLRKACGVGSAGPQSMGPAKDTYLRRLH